MLGVSNQKHDDIYKPGSHEQDDGDLGDEHVEVPQGELVEGREEGLEVGIACRNA